MADEAQKIIIPFWLADLLKDCKKVFPRFAYEDFSPTDEQKIDLWKIHRDIADHEYNEEELAKLYKKVKKIVSGK